MKKLTLGGTIGVLSPSSPASADRVLRAKEAVSRLGYKLSIPIDPSEYYGDNSWGFANGSPRRRLEAFHGLLADPEVEVILCSLGCYGAFELLEHIDFDLVRSAHKLIIGYSDVTALLCAVAARTGIPAIHGPSFATEFANLNDSPIAQASADALLNMLSDDTFRLKTSASPLRPGVGEGPIIAGNLAMLIALLGTPFVPDFDGAVLAVEEVGEAPFRVHRALMQLKLAGKLDRLSALVFGRFSRCEAKAGPSVEETIRRFVSEELKHTSYPILHGFEFGHNGLNLSLPLLCRAVVEPDGGFRLIESPLHK